MNNEVNHWKQQINDLDSANKALTEEKQQIEYEFKDESHGLNGKLQKELNDVYSIKTIKNPRKTYKRESKMKKRNFKIIKQRINSNQ